MPNMKEAKNIYTDAHRHKHTKSYSKGKRDTGNHFQGVKSLAGIIDGSMIALHMKYEGKD